jgi:L-alanine-DL-glutamate epimerase-like enolase superfamily enzyme
MPHPVPSTTIRRVELSRFGFELEGIGLPEHGAAGVGNLIARPGHRLSMQRWAVRIETADGARGEYVTHWVGTLASYAQAAMLAPHLIGRDPDTREEIWQDLRREIRAYDHMGHGPLDIALWDLQARRLGTSVTRMLGGFRARLPTYASTYHGQDDSHGLCSPSAYADYARACQAQGFAGFKIHGWHDGNVRREIETLQAVRVAVGPDWPVMLDCASQLRTWTDALRVGRACDEAGLFWYEDPYRDTGGSVEGHRRLRERLQTPLVMGEHVRGIEPRPLSCSVAAAISCMSTPNTIWASPALSRSPGSRRHWVSTSSIMPAAQHIGLSWQLPPTPTSTS